MQLIKDVVCGQAEAGVGLELEKLRDKCKTYGWNLCTEFIMVALQNLCTNIAVGGIAKNVIDQLLVPHL